MVGSSQGRCLKEEIPWATEIAVFDFELFIGELVKSKASLEYNAVGNANRMRKETPWQRIITLRPGPEYPRRGLQWPFTEISSLPISRYVLKVRQPSGVKYC